MVNEKYARAYVEVLECLKLIKRTQYNRLPKNVIDFLEKNKDNNYNFHIERNSNVNNIQLSKEANAINLYLYLTYFATNEKKEKISNYLNINEKKYQAIIKDKYNPNDIFKNKTEKPVDINNNIVESNIPTIYKKSIFKILLNKLINWIKNK